MRKHQVQLQIIDDICGKNQKLASFVPVAMGSLKTEWLNSKEAAEFLRLSVKALRNKTSNGLVPFYKFGRSNRYRKDELEQMLLSQKRGKQYGY